MCLISSSLTWLAFIFIWYVFVKPICVLNSKHRVLVQGVSISTRSKTRKDVLVCTCYCVPNKYWAVKCGMGIYMMLYWNLNSKHILDAFLFWLSENLNSTTKIVMGSLLLWLYRAIDVLENYKKQSYNYKKVVYNLDRYHEWKLNNYVHQMRHPNNM